MNILIIAAIGLGIYFLMKRGQLPGDIILAQQSQFPTVGFRTVVEFTTSMPVPTSYEPSFGKTGFTFNINVEWKNVDAAWDIIVFMIGNQTIATVHPRTNSGRQAVPVKVDAVPGGQRQIAAMVKNVEGVEHIKAVAYEYISFGVIT